MSSRTGASITCPATGRAGDPGPLREQLPPRQPVDDPQLAGHPHAIARDLQPGSALTAGERRESALRGVERGAVDRLDHVAVEQPERRVHRALADAGDA
jgi:hypothetical protein